MDSVGPLFAFMLGVSGSLHCVGMCGPLAMALPSGKRPVIGRLVYSLGRLFTYTLIGLVAGSVGYLISSAGFQKTLSISAGILILVMALVQWSGNSRLSAFSLIGRWTSGIKSLFRNLFGNRSAIGMFLIGVVNGLLPCGLVYLAAVGAAASHSTLQGISYMLAFGIGTLPAMFVMSFAGSWMGNKWRRAFTDLSPFVAAVVAVWLIYRGVNFEVASCCRHH